MQFVEKRMLRDVPAGLAAELCVNFVGAGTTWRGAVCDRMEKLGINTYCGPWRSETRASRPTHQFHHNGTALQILIYTLPILPVDIDYLILVIATIRPRLILCDAHPKGKLPPHPLRSV